MLHLGIFEDFPALIIIGIVVFFGLIIGGVLLLKKYWKPLKSDEQPKSAEEIAKEEIDRLIETVDEETEEKKDEDDEDISREDDTLDRLLEPMGEDNKPQDGE